MRQPVVPPHPFTAKPPHRPRPPLCPTIIATPSSVASRIPRGCHLTLDALLSSGVAASAATFEKNPRCCSRSDDALYTCMCRAQPRVRARCIPDARANQTPLQTPLTLAACRTLWSLVLGFRLRKGGDVETRRIRGLSHLGSIFSFFLALVIISFFARFMRRGVVRKKLPSNRGTVYKFSTNAVRGTRIYK